MLESMENTNLKNTVVILLLSTPILLQVWWQFTNQGLPLADGGDFYRIAYLIYLAFSESLRSGFYFFFHTGGKPVLFSAFAAPLVFFAQYNILLPIRLTLILIAGLNTWGYYWLFRARITPILSALLASVMMTIPSIYSRSTQFMPEALWPLWFILALACLLRTKNLVEPRFTLLSGLFISLTILARPAESTILFIPLLALLFCYLYTTFTSMQIAKIFLSALLTVTTIVICTKSGSYMSILFIIITSFALFLSAKSNKTGPQIEKLFLPIAIICSVWALFYGSSLLNWTYDNSFGNAAKVNDQVNLGKNILSIFHDVLSFHGMLTISTLFVLMVAALLFSNKQNKFFSIKTAFFIISAVVLALLPFLLAYSLTGTSDMRRIYLSFIFLGTTMPLVGFGLTQPSKRLNKIFFIILFSLLFLQIIPVAAVISNNSHLLSLSSEINSKITPSNIMLPILQKSYDVDVIREIKSAGISDTKIAVFSLGMFTKKVLFQAESLRYVTLKVDKSLTFGTCWAYADYEPYTSVIERLKDQGYHYVLLEGVDDPFTEPALKKKMRSHTFFAHELLQLITKKGEKNLPDLTFIKKFNVEDRQVYLYKIYSSNPPQVTASSQQDQLGPAGLFERRHPGWHSEHNPKYPQTLMIDLHKTSRFHGLGLLPQLGNALRAPKKVLVKVSQDNKAWKTVAVSDNRCDPSASEIWRTVTFSKLANARFIKMDVLSNCGDPNFLTLRGLKLEQS